ncbi:putative inactive 1-aminocyclopropane-1-carboxylate synthase-like [Sesbania bispinosa]|nr:putative inactive 1-aminocyclopropane-1-carboxylate synthase-like [Sesbania bispinosa]
MASEERRDGEYLNKRHPERSRTLWHTRLEGGRELRHRETSGVSERVESSMMMKLGQTGGLREMLRSTVHPGNGGSGGVQQRIVVVWPEKPLLDDADVDAPNDGARTENRCNEGSERCPHEGG